MYCVHPYVFLVKFVHLNFWINFQLLLVVFAHCHFPQFTQSRLYSICLYSYFSCFELYLLFPQLFYHIFVFFSVFFCRQAMKTYNQGIVQALYNFFYRVYVLLDIVQLFTPMRTFYEWVIYIANPPVCSSYWERLSQSGAYVCYYFVVE